jgi:hypothetical protein
VKKSDLHCRDELNEILDAQAKQEQEAVARQMEMEDQQMAVTTEGIEAKAKADQSLAMERMNKIHLDEAISAERIQKAQEESSAQMLNFAKMLKELDGLDVAHLQAKIDMLRTVTEAELSAKAHDHAIDQDHHQREMDHHDVGLRHKELDMQQQQAMAQQQTAASQPSA